MSNRLVENLRSPKGAADRKSPRYGRPSAKKTDISPAKLVRVGIYSGEARAIDLSRIRQCVARLDDLPALRPPDAGHH